MFVKSTPFKQVCQLLLSLIVATIIIVALKTHATVVFGFSLMLDWTSKTDAREDK